jgi:hypothetical protein
MSYLDHQRLRVRYGGLFGLSASGFRRRNPGIAELFPTADEVMLTLEGYYHKVGGSACILYEVPEMRFDVAEEGGELELALPNPKGGFVAVIIDVLASAPHEAETMLDDLFDTCGVVRAKPASVTAIVGLSPDDYMQRLKASMHFLATKLRNKPGQEV